MTACTSRPPDGRSLPPSPVAATVIRSTSTPTGSLTCALPPPTGPTKFLITPEIHLPLATFAAYPKEGP
jgi:hypothetical protein